MGPLAGSILAVLLLKLIKALEYETATPDPEALAPAGPAPSRAMEEQRLENGNTTTRH